jgi:hypothetical protein
LGPVPEPLNTDELATLSPAGAAPLDMAIADGFLNTVSGDAMRGDARSACTGSARMDV